MKSLYGPETSKALSYLGPGQTPGPMIQALAQVKLAAILAQQETCSLYPAELFELLQEAAAKVISGELNEHFPLDLAQGGAGTSLHMNICEVLASYVNRAAECRAGQSPHERLDPLEHLARFQSTNDIFPTSVILMSYRFLERIEQQVIHLQAQLVKREQLYEQWLMCGRTEMQDALPITLGQVFGAWAGPIERDRWRLHKLKERLRTIPLGGTALGTGFSAPRAYVFAAERHLQRLTGLPLCRSQNLCDQVAHVDNLAECARGMGLCADNLYKIASDLILYSSSFCREIRHHEVAYGSTIMPDKANPILLELIRGLAMECSSTADLIGLYARSGQLQLNANLPFLAEQMIRLASRLEKALTTASGPLMEALVPDRERLEANLTSSPALINTLRAALGYHGLKELLPQIKAARISTVQELADWLEAHTELDRAFLDNWSSPVTLTTMKKDFR
ncbi:lyase family protein [Desulfosediminicola ganghwensis]|uniref:lyase family protein n=1 Tax=Desulfosediminicola ganghwensis TaxID=2569540 RepID=UPI0010ABEEE8|nr:lyase family protein [Desulfosediminicola ganghwensis]